MEAIAKLNNCPMSPRKMRLVVDQIRGQRVEDALNTLKYSQKRVVKLVLNDKDIALLYDLSQGDTKTKFLNAIEEVLSNKLK